MHYIVLDLEWNQPLSYNSPVFKAVGDQLLFEMIQIGAVKLNEQLEIEDTLSILIRPLHYVRIHPRIMRMTGITNEDLEEAPSFPQAFEEFVSWCAEDYVLLTWGCDDISVLKQNMDFYKTHPDLPPLYDIQCYFSDVFGLGKERRGLKAAMEQLSIEQQEDKAFHNALDDAYYTSLVFRKLPNPKGVFHYVQQPKKLLHIERVRKVKTPTYIFITITNALHSPLLKQVKCPRCGKQSEIEGAYVPQTGDRYVALSCCEVHGPLFSKVSFFTLKDEKIGAVVTLEMANRMNIAYVHTKQLQYNERVNRLNGWNPEEAFAKAARASVPFEE